jgi:hypothetical protein
VVAACVVSSSKFERMYSKDEDMMALASGSMISSYELVIIWWL